MKIRIDGLNCPNCAKKLEGQINKLDSVKAAEINFLKSTITVATDNEEKALKDIIEVTKQIEPNAKIIAGKTSKNSNKQIFIDLALLFLGIAISVVCLVVSMPPVLYWCLLIFSSLIMGYKTYIKAGKLLLKGIINENLLVTISVFGAIAVGEHFEGLMVIGLYSIGKILEGLALNKSKKSIEALTNFKPEYANKICDGKEVRVSPSEIKIDDIIIVRPGERVSVDGVVVEGTVSLDLQSLTGESLPQTVRADDEVLSGSVVLDGVLKIKATKCYEESTVNTIINLIETAAEKKSKTETFISKIMRWYTLGVIILSITVGSIVLITLGDIQTAIYRGLIFLVVSCPCAFAISVPLSYFSGLGNASKNGILIKGSNFLDALAKIKLVAFDKTGTITTGDFKITNIENFDKKYTKEDVLYIASLGEQYSLHPLAKAIVEQNKRELKEVKNIKEVAGEGVYFAYNKKEYFVGRKSKNLKGTIVEVFENEDKIGEILLQDEIKENSKPACMHLKKLGIKTVMLSGDNSETVTQVANEVGIDEAYSKLLPQEKYKWISDNKEKNSIAYVGDGLNDAPSLTVSTVGFCMGLKGNSASIEASDVVISNDNPKKIPQAVEISKYTRKIVWQNILFSLIVKVLFLTLGSLGVTGMLSAVIADVGVTVLAILNSLRALAHKTNKKN